MKTKEEIIEIALADAKRIYRDLSVYNIKAELREHVWTVSFLFKEPHTLGGGPYYEIDDNTGKILKHIYYQ